MSDFDIAYKITEANEVGFACDPTDRGGMTYDGIARRKNPQWDGWPTIDKIISAVGLNPNRVNAVAKKDFNLQESKKRFYKINYWNSNNLGLFPYQSIANEVYDTGVNMSVGVAARFLQEALNLCNRNEANYKDIDVDGKIGTNGQTMYALRKADEVPVLNVLNMLQGEKYLKILRGDESQEKYLRGWFKRVVFDSRW